MTNTPYSSYSYVTMGNNLPVKVPVGMTTDMYQKLMAEKERTGITVQAQIRKFVEQGLRKTPKNDPLEKRVSEIEQTLAELSGVTTRQSQVDEQRGMKSGFDGETARMKSGRDPSAHKKHGAAKS